MLTPPGESDDAGTAPDLRRRCSHITSESKDAAQAGVEVHINLQPASVAGDPVLLERLDHNLVDNAIRYNLPEHGWIRVTTGLVDGYPPTHRRKHRAERAAP